MPFAITYGHHGRQLVVDAAGEEVASLYYDPLNSEWCLSANARFAVRTALPDVFEGRFAHSFKRYGDVFRFFGLPLTGTDGETVDAGRRAAA